MQSKIDQSQRLYQLDRPLIGITGGIATGKSTVSKYLKQKGYVVICADDLVKKIYKEDHNIHQYLMNHAPSVMASDKSIDFKKLREIFFSNQDVKKNLENLIYSNLPSVFLKEASLNSDASFIFYDVPLLFEKGMENKFDLTLLVYTPKETQVDRLISRDKIDKQLALNIISNQMDIELKKEKADVILSNNADLDSLYMQIDKLLNSSILD